MRDFTHEVYEQKAAELTEQYGFDVIEVENDPKGDTPWFSTVLRTN